MLNYKCTNCGGEFEVHSHGELVCPFCGTKQYFTDSDFIDYNEYRDSLLKFLRAANDSIADEGDILKFWNYANTIKFEDVNGEEIEVAFSFQNSVDGVKSYITKNHVIFIFPPEKKDLADAMIENVEALSFPSADIKNLRNLLPILSAKYKLKNSSVFVAINKPENVYPLFAFSDLSPRQVAWMVSRMENFSCLLEFNGMDHKHMDENSLYINPKTHEAYLLGGWWDAGRSAGRKCLKDLRTTASKLTGGRMPEAPKMFTEFVSSVPKDNAYDDFEYWDEVIEKGFGGHNFAKFGT